MIAVAGHSVHFWRQWFHGHLFLLGSPQETEITYTVHFAYGIMKYVLSFVIRQGKVFAPKHASMSWHCKGEVFSGEDESGVGNSPYPRILDFLPPCWSCLRRTDVILCRELGWELKRSMELLLLSHFSCVRLCETPWMQPTRLPHPWDSPGKNTGVGCHFLLQCMKVKSESEVTQSCLTPSDPMDCSPPGSPIHGIFQARVLEWGAIAFSDIWP